MSTTGDSGLGALAAAITAAATSVHIVTIDGRSGSGKSTVARLIAETTGGTVISVDDFVPGWDRLRDGVDLVSRQIVVPLAAAQPARVQTYDWDALSAGPVVDIAPNAVVIVEGCGAGSIPDHRLAGTRVWVDAPADDREARLRDRADWATYAPHRAGWIAQEEALIAACDPRGRAEVHVRSLPGHRYTVTPAVLT